MNVSEIPFPVVELGRVRTSGSYLRVRFLKDRMYNILVKLYPYSSLQPGVAEPSMLHRNQICRKGLGPL